jgi:FMN reductase
MTRTIAVVTAGLSQPSSTRLLADRLAEAVDRSLRLYDEQVEVVTIELRDLAHALTDHLLTGFPSADLERALSTVMRADAVVAVTPVFSASYSGLFKTFFDVLEPDALAGKPVLVAATAGTARHSLVLDFALRPLFTYLHAVVVPTGVFAASEDFGSRGAAEGSLSTRVDRAARELADLVAGPRPAQPVDPFENPTPFEDLLNLQPCRPPRSPPKHEGGAVVRTAPLGRAHMNVIEVLGSAKDAITVKRVFAEPYEKDGLTVIPAASVGGGVGGGTGHDEKGQEGEGGGLGMHGRPAGAYVIKDGHVSWRPAVDPNRMITVLGMVAVAYLLSRPRTARPRTARARTKPARRRSKI